MDYLKEKQIRLVFYIHPKLREFIGNFHADNNLIELISFNSVPLNQLLMGCSMMITDYSSACWDAYYLENSFSDFGSIGMCYYGVILLSGQGE